jgi:hypothetical protein
MGKTVKSVNIARTLFLVVVPVVLAVALFVKLSTSESPSIAQPVPSATESVAVDENGEPLAFSCLDRKWCEEHMVLPTEEPSND